MCKRCQGHIFVYVDGLCGSEAFGCVCFAFVCESLGHFAEVSVEDALHAFAPRRCEFFVGLGDYGFEVGRKCGVKFAVNVLVLTIFETGVNFFGNGAIFFPYIRYIHCRTASGEVGLAIEANKTLGLVFVALAHGVHLGNIERITALTKNFVFEERCA